MQTLYNVNEVIEKIKEGKKLLLAADENLLKVLPGGDWIAGTIPYFMSSEKGGVFETEKIFVNELPEYVTEVSIKDYNEETLPGIAADEYDNGFSVIIVPGFSGIHFSFANNAMNYTDIYNKPLLGWISGIDLAKLGEQTPKVINGKTLQVTDKTAVVMHCKLSDDKTAKLDILNLFVQGTGDVITFPEAGFAVTDCFVNGEKKNFAQYVTENNIDIKLPLVADFYGVSINTSFQAVDAGNGKVDFYAPVFPGVEYKIAAPVANYVQEFTKAVEQNPIHPLFTCNCILNYLYGELEGKKTGIITGPITFGEIAYQLLNQTLVFLTIE